MTPALNAPARADGLLFLLITVCLVWQIGDAANPEKTRLCVHMCTCVCVRVDLSLCVCACLPKWLHFSVVSSHVTCACGADDTQILAPSDAAMAGLLQLMSVSALSSQLLKQVGVCSCLSAHVRLCPELTAVEVGRGVLTALCLCPSLP